MTRHAPFLLVAALALASARFAHAEDGPASPPPSAEPRAEEHLTASPATADRPAAAADDANRGDGAIPERSAADPVRAPRVRASHRVDVIAPGERVETIVDRMRSDAAARGNAGPRPAQKPPGAPPPDKRRERDRRGPEPWRGPRDFRIGGPGTPPPLPPPPR